MQVIRESKSKRRSTAKTNKSKFMEYFKGVKMNNLETMRHSCSHLMAMAVLEMFPKAKLAIGPAIENGFYYDFELDRPLIPEDLKKLEIFRN